MNNKFFKTWYIVAGVFIGISILYYLVRLYDEIFLEEATSQRLLDLNIFAIISFVIALLMMILAIPLANYMEKKVVVKDSKVDKDKELLAKYKSKKTK